MSDYLAIPPAEIIAPDPLPLVPVNVRLDVDGVHREYMTLGQLVTPGLCITPGMIDHGFSGRWSITHMESGHALTRHQGCLPCVVQAGKAIADEGLDWTRPFETLTAEPRAEAAAHIYRDQMQDCTAYGCYPMPVGVS